MHVVSEGIVVVCVHLRLICTNFVIDRCACLHSTDSAINNRTRTYREETAATFEEHTAPSRERNTPQHLCVFDLIKDVVKTILMERTLKVIANDFYSFLWTHAQRASMLYFADFFLYIFLFPP